MGVLEEQTLEFVLEADDDVELKKQKLLMMNEVVLMMCEMVLASVIQESLMQLQQMNVQKRVTRFLYNTLLPDDILLVEDDEE